MNLQEAIINELLKEDKEQNPIIYKIILKDGTELSKEYTDLKEAQDEAEKLDAKNVKIRYKYNDVKSLFKIFIHKEDFNLIKWMKYENNKFYIQDNFGWHEAGNQDNYKISVKLPPYFIGRETDPYSVEDYKTYIIVDTQTGDVYENEDVGDYTSITEIKEGLQQVLNQTYGEKLDYPYYWDPLDY